MMDITSLTNPKVRRVAALKNRRAREEAGLTIIDGWREVLRAREAGIVFEEIYLCPPLLERFCGEGATGEIASWAPKVFAVSQGVFERMCFGERREGILAVARSRDFPLEASVLPQNPLIVVLESVEKPGNLGAVLRVCDGAGVDAVIVADTKTDILNPNVIRASTGVVFSMRIMQGPSAEVQAFLADRGVRTVAAVPDGGEPYYSIEMRGPVALVLGAEDEGLSRLWIQSADARAEIPMQGRADSLNVSTAAAVLIYEARRQRGFA